MVRSKSAPPTVDKPASDLTLEQARDTRARAWRFVFDCYAKKKAAGSTQDHDGDEPKGSRNDQSAKSSIP
jgi:hypothetical protein